MVTELNIGQFRTWLNNAPPEDLVTVAPQVLSRIGALDERHQDQFIQEIQNNPQATSLFKKLQTSS